MKELTNRQRSKRVETEKKKKKKKGTEEGRRR